MTRHRARQAGLTLVEMLVALGIFALIGTASVGVVSLALSGQAQMTAQSDALGAVERTRSLLRADLAQLVDRPVREAARVGGGLAQAGDAPALAGGDALPEDPEAARLGTLLLALTRTGWDNPGDARPRSELQRVEYRLRERQLIRRTRPYLDAAPDTPHTERVLLDGVGAAEAFFWDGQSWRPGFASAGGGDFPAAVRLTVEHAVYGRIENDFLVGGRR